MITNKLRLAFTVLFVVLILASMAQPAFAESSWASLPSRPLDGVLDSPTMP